MGKHRLEALADGIFAVAMTLLVIELKLPHLEAPTQAALVQELAHLLPKFIAWVISFLVLAFFWWGHHRGLHRVRHVDGRFVALNVLFLGTVSFMPFASALVGEWTRFFASQLVYSLTMAVMALLSAALWHRVYTHPEMCDTPMTRAEYHGALLRTGMLVVISLVALVLAWFAPGTGNMAFMLMSAAGPLARRLERRKSVVQAAPAA